MWQDAEQPGSQTIHTWHANKKHWEAMTKMVCRYLIIFVSVHILDIYIRHIWLWLWHVTTLEDNWFSMLIIQISDEFWSLPSQCMYSVRVLFFFIFLLDFFGSSLKVGLWKLVSTKWFQKASKNQKKTINNICAEAVAVILPRLVPRALLVGGPPCSLFIGASSSVHLRHIWTPWGDRTNKKVRLSNLIWANFVPSL